MSKDNVTEEDVNYKENIDIFLFSILLISTYEFRKETLIDLKSILYIISSHIKFLKSKPQPKVIDTLEGVDKGMLYKIPFESSGLSGNFILSYYKLETFDRVYFDLIFRCTLSTIPEAKDFAIKYSMTSDTKSISKKKMMKLFKDISSQIDLVTMSDGNLEKFFTYYVRHTSR